jgi:hypothetical protein
MDSTHDLLECPICLELMADSPITLSCGHTGCRECLLEWVHEQPVCPVCRGEATPETVAKLQISIIIQNMAAPLAGQMRADAKQLAQRHAKVEMKAGNKHRALKKKTEKSAVARTPQDKVRPEDVQEAEHLLGHKLLGRQHCYKKSLKWVVWFLLQATAVAAYGCFLGIREVALHGAEAYPSVMIDGDTTGKSPAGDAHAAMADMQSLQAALRDELEQVTGKLRQLEVENLEVETLHNWTEYSRWKNKLRAAGDAYSKHGSAVAIQQVASTIVEAKRSGLPGIDLEQLRGVASSVIKAVHDAQSLPLKRARTAFTQRLRVVR